MNVLASCFPFLSEKNAAFVLAVLLRRRRRQLLISMQSLPLSSSVERTPLLKHRSRLCLACSEGEKLNKQIDLFLQVVLPHPTGAEWGAPSVRLSGQLHFPPQAWICMEIAALYWQNSSKHFTQRIIPNMRVCPLGRISVGPGKWNSLMRKDLPGVLGFRNYQQIFICLLSCLCKCECWYAVGVVGVGQVG